MDKGKLVWSSRWPDGIWRTSSEVDDNTWYTCANMGRGKWVAEVHWRDTAKGGPVAHTMTLNRGESVRLLKDAKRLCDVHHHEAIREHGDAGLRSYAERWPLV